MRRSIKAINWLRNMLRIIALLLLLITVTAKGQVINNLSPDRSNIYFHALDSVIKILKRTESIGLVIVYGDKSITQNFPNEVDGIKLVKPQQDSTKILKIKKREARLSVRAIQIIRDEFKIPILAAGHNGRLGDGMYIFCYQYIPETMTFKLKKIELGIVL